MENKFIYLYLRYLLIEIPVVSSIRSIKFGLISTILRRALLVFENCIYKISNGES